MALTSVGAIYATKSKLLQRIYIPHGDDSEIAEQHVGQGETLALIPIEIFRTGGQIAIQNAIGEPEFSGHCVVVNDANEVIDHIIADPELYSDPRGKVIHYHLWVKDD